MHTDRECNGNSTFLVRAADGHTRLEQVEYAKKLIDFLERNPILVGYSIGLNRRGDVVAFRDQSPCARRTTHSEISGGMGSRYGTSEEESSW